MLQTTKACLEALLSIERPTLFIQGNCEVAVVDQSKGKGNSNLPAAVLENIRWTAQEISPHHLDIIDSWPSTITLESERGKILFLPRYAQQCIREFYITE